MKTNRDRKINDAVGLEQKVEDVEKRARLLENERRDLLLQDRVETLTELNIFKFFKLGCCKKQSLAVRERLLLGK